MTDARYERMWKRWLASVELIRLVGFQHWHVYKRLTKWTTTATVASYHGFTPKGAWALLKRWQGRGLVQHRIVYRPKRRALWIATELPKR